MLNLKIESTEFINFWTNSNSYYSMQSFDKFINYFFPENIQVSICDKPEYDTVIYDIQDDKQQIMDKSKINIMLCVENCYAHKHYKHYNIFGDFGNPKIDIYLYNHIARCIVNDKYIAIPIIYLQMDYLKKKYNKIRPNIITPFLNKKFCLFASSNTYIGAQKKQIKTFLNSIGMCDDINNFKKDIKNRSCYHSVELMNLFNQYKFIFVSENSIADGYITEKIFNCYFSQSIPIYFGSPIINKFFNSNSFININDFGKFPVIKEQIKELCVNESLFNKFIDTEIINSEYDDENYKLKIENFIKSCDRFKRV